LIHPIVSGSDKCQLKKIAVFSTNKLEAVEVPCLLCSIYLYDYIQIYSSLSYWVLLGIATGIKVGIVLSIVRVLQM
jgi:hypothetical protein